MTFSRKQTKWEDIPPEILDQILVHLDDKSLLALGKLSRMLNYWALARLFGPERVDSSQKSVSLRITPHSPREMIPGLRAALWIERITHLDFLMKSTAHDLLHDMHKFTALIREIPSLGGLNLGMLVVGRYSWCVDPDEAAALFRALNTVEDRGWLAALNELVEIALVKGCEILRIEGGMIQDWETCSIAFGSSLKRKFLRRIGWHPFRVSIPETAFSKLRLRKLVLGEVMLQPSTLLYTINLCNIGALTNLRHLEFTGKSRYIVIGKGIWKKLLRSIELPALETFKADDRGNRLMPMRCLAEFLSRHSSIVYLAIHLSEVWKQRVVLPNLRVFKAPLQAVTWFLVESQEAGPNVEYVEMKIVAKDCDKLGDMIEKLDQRDHPPSTISLYFIYRVFYDWAKRIVDIGTIDRRLSKVRRLVIQLGAWNTYVDENCVKWIGLLFSGLEELEVVYTNHSGMTFEAATSFAERVPGWAVAVTSSFI